MNIPGLTYDDGFKKGREFGNKEVRDFVKLMIKFPQIDTPEKVLEQIDDYLLKAEQAKKDEKVKVDEKNGDKV